MDLSPPAPIRPSAPAGRRTTRVGAVLAAAALTVLGVAGPAASHVTVTSSTTAAGETATLDFSFSHGCDGSPTTAVTVRMPEGVDAVTPVPDPAWDVELEKEDGRVAAITWSIRTPVPEGVRESLELSLRLPESAGETLAFPVIQTCLGGESAWIDVAADAADAEELEHPAPTITLAAATGQRAAAEAPATLRGASRDGPVDTWGVVSLAVGVIAALLGGAALLLRRRRA